MLGTAAGPEPAERPAEQPAERAGPALIDSVWRGREALLRRDLADLVGYARALLSDAGEAEDLVQDCLAHMLAHRHDPPPSLLQMRRRLLAAARAQELARRFGGVSIVSIAEVGGELVCQPPQELALMLRDLARALAQLPPSRREAIRLLVLEELSCRQVAERLQVPIGTVRSRVHRARAALRRLVDGEGGAPGLGSIPERPIAGRPP
jgi:RNA polymerase sigma-70 factor (ECF subfamily)